MDRRVQRPRAHGRRVLQLLELRNIIGEGGGAVHAIWGTLIITGLATLISVPIGLMTSIYLIEYGNGNRLSRAITFFVETS